MNAPLPSCCVITPEPASASDADCRAFVDRLSAVLARGETLVQLRVKSFDEAAFARLAADALACCHAAGAQLIVNGRIDADAVLALDGAGWHLDGAALRAAVRR
ncbi:thiamine phosphate synthase, partial [Burkholderia sp. Ac-20353]|uniref:thiamine phosphate synthase n=1 Tax=Burkholderia sp. Ac-20353 TaxID=2703894 RepID=UPI00197C42AA